MSTAIVDDKSPHVVPFLLTHLHAHLSSPNSNRPFIVALNGVQGIGKTTLVSALASTLSSAIQALEPSSASAEIVLVLSLDDFYLTYKDQTTLAAANADNALLQHRGEPGTHDIPLLIDTCKRLSNNEDDVPVPSYDKSAYGGKGDRVPVGEWRRVNRHGEAKVRVLVLEGWCVGYRSLPDEDVKRKWEAAPGASSSSTSPLPSPFSRLKAHPLEHLRTINSLLASYAPIIADLPDAFVHLDAESPTYAYVWRREQEAALRKVRGEGNAMSDEEVGRFVDGYFPAYELYLEGVRGGVLRPKDGEGAAAVKGRQLRLMCNRDRKVKEVVVI